MSASPSLRGISDLPRTNNLFLSQTPNLHLPLPAIQLFPAIARVCTPLEGGDGAPFLEVAGAGG
jgi:hypothetical protein